MDGFAPGSRPIKYRAYFDWVNIPFLCESLRTGSRNRVLLQRPLHDSRVMLSGFQTRGYFAFSHMELCLAEL